MEKKQMENQTKARILLLGKTGVGKSSFINYFLDKEVAKTGIGNPVTSSMEAYEIDVNETFGIEVYDTKGIEVENAEAIVDEIMQEIKKRNHDMDVTNWFHTIFYCVSMNNARLEDYEINFINRMKDSISQQIHIILTNCDGKEQTVIEAMKGKIENSIGTPKVFEVCSVETTKRNGTKSEPFGKDKLMDQVFTMLWEDICSSVAPRVEVACKEDLKRFWTAVFDELILSVKKEFSLLKWAMNHSLLDQIGDRVFHRLEDEVEERILESLNEHLYPMLKSALELYNNYSSTIRIEAEDVISADVFTELMYDLDSYEIMEKGAVGKLLERYDELEDGFSLTHIKLLADTAGMLLNTKKHILQLITDIKVECNHLVDSMELKEAIYNQLIEVSKVNSYE